EADRGDRFRLHDAGNQDRRCGPQARRGSLSRTVPMTGPKLAKLPATPQTKSFLIAGLVAVLFVTLTIAVMIGPVSIRPGVVWRFALDNLVPGWLSPSWQPFEASIVWEVRLP